MSLRSLFLAALVAAVATYTAVAEDAAPTTPATTPVAAAPTTTPATPVTTTAAAPAPATTASLPAIAGLDTDAAADAVSETFLTLTLAYFNQSYLGSGIFADTIAAEAYEDADSDELLDAQVALALQVEQQIQALAKAPGHDKDDMEVIEGFIKLGQLNRIQWETLRDVLGGDEGKSKIWEEVRDTMLKELEKYAADEPEADPTTAPPSTAAPTTTVPTTETPAAKTPASAAIRGPVLR